MPELPEVETIKRQLTPSMVNKRIINYFSSGKKLRREIPDFEPLLNQMIVNIYRRNKYLIFELDNYWLIIHLGMTGKLIEENLAHIKKHTHLLLSLSGQSFLNFEDARRFGSLDIFSKQNYPEYNSIPLFKSLGLEPLDKNFTLSKVDKLLIKKSTAIKKILMDSNIICGIGNIYASEILFASKVHPEKLGINLTKKEIESIYFNIIKILKKAISLGGSSISDFVHTNGRKGTMQDNYFVYGRYKESCKNCSTPIEKMAQGGRTTFYCPQCQKMSLNKDV